MFPVFEAKVSQNKWFLVELLDATNGYDPETGVAFGDVTVKYGYEDDTIGAYSVATENWFEAGEGAYWLQIGESEFVDAGKYTITVAASGCRTFRFGVEARTYTIEDMFTGSNIVTLKMKQVDINNAYGTAFVAKSTGSDGDGIEATGDGAGNGMKCTGGASDGNGQYNKGGGDYGCGQKNQGYNYGCGQWNIGASSGQKNQGDNLHGQHNIGGYDGAGVYIEGYAASEPGPNCVGVKITTPEECPAVVVDGGSGVGDSDAIQFISHGTGSSIKLISDIYGKELDAKEIGAPSNLGGGADISSNLSDIYAKEETIISDVAIVDGKVFTVDGKVDAVDAKVVIAIADIATVDGKVDVVDGNVDLANVAINATYARVGDPSGLDSGTSIADNLISMANKDGGLTYNPLYDSLEAVSEYTFDSVSETALKNLLFTRNVTARHTNEKPKTISAGSGASLVTVTTTLDPVSPEQIKTESWV